MTSLNLSSNALGEAVLPAGWTKRNGDYVGDLAPPCWDPRTYGPIYEHSDGKKHRQQIEHPGEAEGIIAIANAMPDMRAMTSLNLSSNYLEPEGAKIVAKAIKVKCTTAVILVPYLCAHLTNCSTVVVCYIPQEMGAMRSLNLASNSLTAAGIRGELFEGALLVLSLKDNKLLTKDGGSALARALANNSILKELDVSSNNWKEGLGWKGDGPGFAQELAVGIKNNGSISSINLLKNDTCMDQAHVLASILKDHPTLKSLCGNKGNEVELDMSGKMDGAADAIMLVPEITDNGAMTSLNLASNHLCGLNKDGHGTYDASGNSLLRYIPCSHTNMLHTQSRRYRHCQCHQGYEGPIGGVFEKQQPPCGWCQGSG
jgi:hypothetical protein